MARYVERSFLCEAASLRRNELRVMRTDGRECEVKDCHSNIRVHLFIRGYSCVQVLGNLRQHSCAIPPLPLTWRLDGESFGKN
jgi:hypothetical protein